MPYKNRERQLHYWRDYTHTHRQQANTHQQTYYWKMRTQVFLILGHRCVCCGSTSMLVVDHIKPRQNNEMNTAMPNMQAVLAHKDPKSKFQTLCDSCNSSKANTLACRLEH